MQIEHINILKLTDLLSNTEEECYVDDNIVYCEMKFKRDRSSYAGMAFKIIDKKNTFLIRKSREKIVQEVSPYEKIFKGCEQDYVDSVKEIYLSEDREYGIDIYFLIYSDVRSSQIIFEELMKNVNEHIDEIKNI